MEDKKSTQFHIVYYTN